jgi:hypothetical protein
MTPKQYLDRYTYLKFFSPLNFGQVPAGLTNYGAGKTRHGDGVATSDQIERERSLFTSALRKAHHGNANTPCGERFFFDQRPLGLIPASEDFYGKSIARAFLGKGSPDEIIDTLRLAMAIGRIGTDRDANGQAPARSTAQAYVKSFITLDCNGFAGSYFGVNGDVDISTFAVAGRRRSSMGEVRVGDAVVTHCTTVPCEHVGVIDGFVYNGDGTADIQVAEWGWWGGEEVHHARISAAKIRQGPDPRYGLGWATTSNKVKGTPSFRYIFGRPSAASSLGWL